MPGGICWQEDGSAQNRIGRRESTEARFKQLMEEKNKDNPDCLRKGFPQNIKRAFMIMFLMDRSQDRREIAILVSCWQEKQGFYLFG